jgi:hypothetical protein
MTSYERDHCVAPFPRSGDPGSIDPGDTDHLERFIIEKVSYRMDDASTAMSLREKGPAAMAESDTEDLEGAIAAA